MERSHPNNYTWAVNLHLEKHEGATKHIAAAILDVYDAEKQFREAQDDDFISTKNQGGRLFPGHPLETVPNDCLHQSRLEYAEARRKASRTNLAAELVKFFEDHPDAACTPPVDGIVFYRRERADPRS